jgi:hypothetical protein
LAYPPGLRSAKVNAWKVGFSVEGSGGESWARTRRFQMNRKKVTAVVGGVGVAALIATAGSAYTQSITGMNDREVAAYLPFSISSDSGSVDWGKYRPDLKDRIDSYYLAKDCKALQKERDSYGKDEALMAYIDQKLKAADCTS